MNLLRHQSTLHLLVKNCSRFDLVCVISNLPFLVSGKRLDLSQHSLDQGQPGKEQFETKHVLNTCRLVM